MHSRLRMGLSGLNHHRKDHHFIESGACNYCDSKREDTIHYMFVCPSFAAQRAEMPHSIGNTLPIITTHIPALKDKISLSQKLLFGTDSFDFSHK